MPNIKTNIKFFEQPDGKSPRLCGLVTKVDHSWRGCRENDECKKMIVIPDVEIEKELVPNVLYSCSLIPMTKGKGFVAISATMVQFKARIDTHVNPKTDTFKVTVSWGNKRLVYDPSHPKEVFSTPGLIAEMIKKRLDMKKPLETAEDFINAAVVVKRMYEIQLESQCS